MRFSFIIVLLLALSLPLFAQTDEGFANAVAARQEGRIKAAVSLFRQATGEALGDYAQFEIGETYFASGEYSAAIPEYYKVATNHPESILLPRAYLMLGKSYYNLKKYPHAVRSFRSLLQKYPEADEAAEARFLIAKSLQLEGKWKEAYLAYEETDLYHPLSNFGKRSRLAIKSLKKAHKRKLPRFKASAAALFKKGITYFEQDDFEMAANIFNRLAREYPKSKYVGEAWLMLGRAELQTSQYSSAISDFKRASQGPSNLAGRASYYLGLAYGRRGYFDSAIAALKKVPADSGLADDAAYWAAYYYELKGDLNTALTSYYDLISKYPYSKAVPPAIWRMGKIYYWNSDFKNAATYLHMAQLYPPGEDTPRCYFFEAKALERTGNRTAALDVYKKLIQRFDHTYYAYRAQEKLKGNGIPLEQSPFDDEEFTRAIDDLGNKDKDELAAIMEIWEQTNADAIPSESSEEARVHLEKYKELMTLGLTNYAADEARYLVNITSAVEKESAQIKLGEVLIRSGEYRTPIRFADPKIKSAIMAGRTESLPKKIWPLSYPKGYWSQVVKKAGDFGLDPYLVLAVIREESRFNPKATSRSSARGLMQIMPRTGSGIAKDLDVSRYRTSRLYEPALNIEMGVYFLSSLVKNFKDNAYLALAGYNGGPNRIKRYVNSWYNGNLGLVDIDEFIESIPIRETRLYVQKVMGSYFEYKRLYDRKRG